MLPVLLAVSGAALVALSLVLTAGAVASVVMHEGIDHAMARRPSGTQHSIETLASVDQMTPTSDFDGHLSEAEMLDRARP